MCKFIRDDPLQSMGSRHPALAKSVPSNFPNPDIIYLYLFPLTSPKSEIRDIRVTFHLPDVVQITHLCELYFPWATTDTIVSKFDTGVFQATLMAVLREEVAHQDNTGASAPSQGIEARPFVCCNF